MNEDPKTQEDAPVSREEASASDNPNNELPKQDSHVWDLVFALLFLAIGAVALVFSGRAVSSDGVLGFLPYPAPTPELAWAQTVEFYPTHRSPFPEPPREQVEIAETELGVDLLQEAVFDTFETLPEKLLQRKKTDGGDIVLSLLIDKKSHLLNVLSNGHVAKRYLVSFGRQYRAGPKRRIDDLRTPSGTYFILNKIEKDAKGARLVLSYPNLIDLSEAVKEGVLTSERFEELRAAALKKRYSPPPEMGQVSIFVGVDPLRIVGEHLVFDNASDGSISMNRKDFEELFSLLPVGTRITIQD